MRKKILLGSLCVVLFACNVFAQGQENEFKITDSLGVEKEVFGFNETPWLFVDLKNKDSSIEGWWKRMPGGGNNPIADTGSQGGIINKPLAYWGWNHSEGVSEYMAHLNGYGTKKFTVTPEPLSSLLFLLGGPVFAARIYARRKKSEINKRERHS